MHICFVDESGPTPKPQKATENTYFVIAGLILPASQWHEVANSLNDLRSAPRFNVTGEIKWQYFGPRNQNPENSLAHLDEDDRNAFRDGIFEIINNSHAKIVACVAKATNAYRLDYVNNPEDLYQFTYKPVSERFQYHLQDISTPDTKECGIVVCDHRNNSQDNELRAKHFALVSRDSPNTSTYENYIETVFLTPSDHSVGIQLADIVAGSIARKFNHDDDRFIEALRGSFRFNPRTRRIRGYGLVRFPNDWE